MKKVALLSLFIAATMTIAPQVNARTANLSSSQKEAIQNLIEDYLTKNPQVIIQALDSFKNKEQEDKMQALATKVEENKKDIYEDPNTPVMGDKKAPITIVEWFDFRCGYCKSIYKSLMEIAAKNKDVKILFKDLPVLGDDSLYATKAAIAANFQGKYVEFHKNLMEFPTRLNKTKIIELAEKTGLDMDKLKKDMEGAKTAKIIADNRILANKIGVRGTPFLIIGDFIAPGALPTEKIEEIIAEQRKK